MHPDSKIPAVGKWETVATRDPRQIQQWWSAGPYNIGIACGPSRLLVIDIDVSDVSGIGVSNIDMHGLDGAEDKGQPPPPSGVPLHGSGGHVGGVEVLIRGAAEVGAVWPLPTYSVTTPRGGRHWYFRAPDGPAWRNTQAVLGASVDTRGRGGFVVAAGSTDRRGRRYRVALDHPHARPPDWLIAALTPAPFPPPRPDATGRSAPPGQLSHRRVEAYLRAVIAGETAVVANARVGQRHAILLAAARRLGHWVGGGLLPDDVARAALTQAARHFVGVAGYTTQQVARDIDDGITYGARMPRGTAFIADREREDRQR